MNIQVNIDPETINEQVTNAIINSALGEKLTEAINKRLKEILDGGYYRSDIVSSVVDEQMRLIIRQMLQQPEVYDKIKAMVERWFVEKFTDEVMSAALGRLWDKLMDR